MISIIIRTKNEERWMRPCLEAVMAQRVDMPVEVVLVDNASTDKTVDKAQAIMPGLKLVRVEEFLPGRAINDGIRAASGDYIVCLSAHCIPVNENWLARLLANFDGAKDLAGVYGRQVPVSFSSPSDKRDLLITFGLDRRVQYKDPFFHNANSMVPRHVWERFPFDEDVTNIEDRLWAKDVLGAGMHIVYEPDAPVYHHHGIHQNNDVRRAESVVRIMEAEKAAGHEASGPFRSAHLDTVAVLPVRASLADLDRGEMEALFDRTLASLSESRQLSAILVSTDDPALAGMARDRGFVVPDLRPPELAEGHARFDDVLAFELRRLEESGRFPDAVLSLEITHPFRQAGFLDRLLEEFFNCGAQTLVAGVAEFRPCWVREGSEFQRIDGFLRRRDEREPLHVALPGLGCVSLPAVIRSGKRFGSRTTILELADSLAAVEVRSKAAFQRVRPLLTADARSAAER
ncbi:glycosyltransferase family 2 protein [Blastochloris sulfoviridis]|uniref:Glycosyltransferase family 2 protein n=1 Tax=Blastochloris sulfoviridis TaxID=50712 RepID=A0A5M6HMU9_9HYPH|nr:glycosyltransferase family 2 protein [Blastochloris sulfoviridis]KAA5597151.1 glycosyltransferase family 2 protein [Blastochloris sulfoviridis]